MGARGSGDESPVHRADQGRFRGHGRGGGVGLRSAVPGERVIARAHARNAKRPAVRSRSGDQRARQGGSWWDDPPLIDHPELPFVSTNVIARRSLLRRAIPLYGASDTGCPVSAVPTWLTRPPRFPGSAFASADVVGPVARSTPSCGSSPPDPPPTPPRVRCALSGVNDTLIRPFPQVKGYFSSHRLIHRIRVSSPEVSRSSTARPHLRPQFAAFESSCGSSRWWVADPRWLTFRGEGGTIIGMSLQPGTHLARIIIIR